MASSSKRLVSQSVTSVLLLLPALVAANETNLDTLVVTATRSEKTLATTPLRTQVISRNDIDRRQSKNLADALRELAGIQLQDIHGKPGESVRIQGMDSDRVLILIDGRPVAATTGSTVDATQITTYGVERIEVIKGPASALYGSSAMGGVVNVITRRESGEPKLALSAQIGSWADKNLAEEPGSHNISLNGSGGTEHWISQFALGRDHSEGFDLTPDTYASSGAAGDRDHLNWRNSVFISDDYELYADLRMYREELHYRTSVLTPGAVDGITKKTKNGLVDRDSLTLGLDGFLWGGELSSYAHVEQFEEITEQDAIASAWVDQSRTAELDTLKTDLKWDKTLNKLQTLTLGYQGSRAELEQIQLLDDGNAQELINELEGSVKHNSHDIYAQHDWLNSEQTFELLSGLRFQDDSDFGSHIAPKLGFRQTLSHGFVLRASIGEGYRVPNLKERHYVFDHSANGYMVLGNEDLQPETNRNVQLDLHWQNQQHLFSVNVYHHDLKQLIETELDNVNENGISIYRYLNINEARIYGAELQYKYMLSNGDSLSFDLERLSTLNRESKQKLANRPELQAGALWKTSFSKDIGASLGWRYQSGGVSDTDYETELRHASIVNASVHWALNANTKLSVNIDNIGDSFKQREDNSDLRPAEGRELRLTLDYNFL